MTVSRAHVEKARKGNCHPFPKLASGFLAALPSGDTLGAGAYMFRSRTTASAPEGLQGPDA